MSMAWLDAVEAVGEAVHGAGAGCGGGDGGVVVLLVGVGGEGGGGGGGGGGGLLRVAPRPHPRPRRVHPAPRVQELGKLLVEQALQHSILIYTWFPLEKQED